MSLLGSISQFLKTFSRFYRVSFWGEKQNPRTRKELKRMDDHKLMQLYAEKNNCQAFEILLQRYKSQVFGYLVNACRNKSRAEDLFQEVFLRIIRSSRDYKAKASFRTWIFTISRNLVIDEFRRQNNKPLLTTLAQENSETGEVTESAYPDNKPTADTELEAREIRYVIEETLKELPEEQREIFLLRESAGLSYKEAARVANCSVNTVKSRMRYAILKIKENLEIAGLVKKEVK